VSDGDKNDIGGASPQTAREAAPGQDHVRRARRLRYGLTIAGGVLLLVLAGVGGLGAWRLSQGPISLDRLTPLLARSLSSDGIAVVIDHAALSWESNHQLRIVATGVHLSQAESGAQLTFREMDMEPSLRGLLTGNLVPSRLTLSEPDLRLQRAADGSYRLGLGGEGGVQPDESSQFWGKRLLDDITASPEEAGPLSYLRELELRNAAVTVEDRSLGITWHADRADLTLDRDAAGITGKLSLVIGTEGKEATISGDVAYRRGGTLMLKLGFGGLNPALFAPAAPDLAVFAALDAPISGTMSLAFDPVGFALSGADCDLIIGTGMLRGGDFPEGGIKLASGAIKGHYDPAAGRVTIDSLALDLGGPKATISGSVDHIGRDLLAGSWPQQFDVAANFNVESLPVDAFPVLWPEHFGALTRSWITQHVHDGMLDTINGRLEGQVDLTPGVKKPINASRLDGTASYHNLTIEYFAPLEPVRGIDGTATFDRTQIDFAPVGGHVLDGQVTHAAVKLYQLDTNDETADVDVTVQGPVREALTVLDTEPLGYAKALSLDAAHASGDFTARMFFRVPLKHDLNLDEVEYRADADLTGVAVPNAVFNRDLSDGNFHLMLDSNALRLDGTANLAAVPVKLNWMESFVSSEAVKRRYTVQARIDDSGWTQLGLNFSDFGTIKGPVDVELFYGLARDAKSRRAQATVSADFKDAAVDFGKLGWIKPAGVPATAKFALDLADDRLTAIRDVALTGNGIDARLAAAFDQSGLTRLDFPRFIAGDSTNVSGSLERMPSGGWRLTVRGTSYDASALFDELSQPTSNPQPPALAIDAKLDRLVVGPQRQVTQLTASLASDGPHWTDAVIDANLTGNNKFAVRFGGAAGAGKFDLKADDFGAFLALIDVTGNVQGGSFAITGNAVDDNGKRVLKGTLLGADYRIVRAPLFARLLSVASLSGAGALLNGTGIPFSKLEGDIVYGGGRIAVSNLRAYGGAIGINVDGEVNYDAGTLDASGTLVPAYTLNSVLGNIPVLGSLLMGGEGQGLFGANFRMAGPLADPQISVNPLSAFAPGALRRLFVFKAWNPNFLSGKPPAVLVPDEPAAPPSAN
jgi:hypothetical protein